MTSDLPLLHLIQNDFIVLLFKSNTLNKDTRIRFESHDFETEICKYLTILI